MTAQYVSPGYYRQRISTDHWWGRLLRWILGPVGLIGSISLCVLLVNFYFAYRVHPFNGDDVILQNALLYWKPFHHMIYYGDAAASYLDRMPLYWLVGRVLSPGRHALFVDGLLLAVGNFILCYWSAVYLLKKAGLRLTYLTLVPFIWLSSLGYAVSELFVQTSMHNIEVGIILAICVLAMKIYYGELRPLASWKARVLTVICSFVIGYTIVGDRYVLYYGLLPILACAAAIFLYKRQPAVLMRIGLIFGAAVLSFVFAALIQFVLSKSGVDFMVGVGARAPQFVSYNALFPSIAGTISNLFVIFNADFWGGNVLSIISISMVLNGILLFLILRSAVVNLRSESASRLDARNMPLQLIAILFVWAVGILTLSSIGGSGTFHYLVILPFVGTILLAGLLAVSRGVNLRLLAVLVLMAAILNTGVNLYSAKHTATISPDLFSGFDKANTHDSTVIVDLEAHGLTGSRGYASYWQANITSYLSGGKLDVLPSLCTNDGKSVVYQWLMTSSQLTRPTAKTFFMYDPRIKTALTCLPKDFYAQYGPPAQSFVTDGVTVYVYDRNIAVPLQ